MRWYFAPVLLLFMFACASERSYPALITHQPQLAADVIMQRAHKAAGGDTWVRPVSLSLKGYAVFYKDGISYQHESHRMWRVYAVTKTNAHVADGKVRIESIRDGKTAIDLSFDGETTYTQGGVQPRSEADKRWSSNFGFGVVRHALDEGYSLSRLPDDLIDGVPCFVVLVSDPAGNTTQFAVAQHDYSLRKVGFDTGRGWHERIYSDFFRNPASSWVQPGRVRLFYNGVKSNEVIWTSYEINQALPDCLFVLPEDAACRDEITGHHVSEDY